MHAKQMLSICLANHLHQSLATVLAHLIQALTPIPRSEILPLLIKGQI